MAEEEFEGRKNGSNGGLNELALTLILNLIPESTFYWSMSGILLRPDRTGKHQQQRASTSNHPAVPSKLILSYWNPPALLPMDPTRKRDRSSSPNEGAKERGASLRTSQIVSHST